MVVWETDQILQKVDFQALSLANQLRGVVRGLAVSKVAGAMRVSVASGLISWDGRQKSVPAIELTVPAAHPDHPRRDIVVIDGETLVRSIKAGIPEPIYPDPSKIGIFTRKPRPPSLGEREILLAELWIPAKATEVHTVYDKRHFVDIRPPFVVPYLGDETEIIETSTTYVTRKSCNIVKDTVRIGSPSRLIVEVQAKVDAGRTLTIGIFIDGVEKMTLTYTETTYVVKSAETSIEDWADGLHLIEMKSRVTGGRGYQKLFEVYVI